MSLYGTEWRERGFGLCGVVCPDPLEIQNDKQIPHIFYAKFKIEPDLGLSKGRIRRVNISAALQ